MATSSTGTGSGLVRTSIDDGSTQRRSRKISTGVSFQPKLSVFSITGTENEYDMNDDQGLIDEEFTHSVEHQPWWVYVAENSYFRQFFRAISIVNLIVMILSIPFANLNNLDDSSYDVVSIQFIVVTIIDFILACIYTFHLIIRIRYYWKISQEKKFESDTSSVIIDTEDDTVTGYAKWSRTVNVFILTVCMWYSVGIGVYRIVIGNPVISHWWYIGFLPRAIFAVFPSINLLLKVESSAARKLYGLLKWKQLAMVTGFYFIFVFIFALMGVHLIGGLEYICMEETIDEDGMTISVPAIPLTHCNPNNENRAFFCQLNDTNTTGLVCLRYPPDAGGKLFFSYRSYVYYGQFRVILDALYAVYEASTLEFWSLMMYTAAEGNSGVAPFIFYFFLVLFVVYILQQSIFLVVIIESFADLRDDSLFFWGGKSSSQKTSNKPSTVLTLEDPATTRLTLRSLDNDTSPMFLNKYGKFLVWFEKVFLLLVAVDALVTATKYVGMTKEHQLVLKIWQPFVSFLFLMEISFVLFFHLYHGQWKLFFRRPYYICLIVLAIGGLVASLPFSFGSFHFYDPYKPSSPLAVFQALRFPRLLRLWQSLWDFVLKITGKTIPILTIIISIVILWLALLNAVIFGYSTDFPDECKELSSEHFGTFFNAFGSTFQLVMNEAWTDVTSEVMCRSSYWFVTNLYFIVIHLFSSLIILNFFGAVILDNLEYDEEEKKTKLEELKKKEAEYGETVPYKLRIFKKLGNEPKKLKPPPGIVEDPKLDELEVRKFFDSANTANLIEDPQDLLSLQTYYPPANKQESGAAANASASNTPKLISRQASQLQQLSLVSDNSDLIPSETTPELHGIYNSITTLLNYISLWRKYNEKEQSKDPRSSNIHYLFGQSPYERKKYNVNRNVKSEYDIFREKHRFFDLALFCMPPEHKLRKFCTTLLTAQARSPSDVVVQNNRMALHAFTRKISFFLRLIVSQLPYCTWIVFLSLVGFVLMQVWELSHDSFHVEHTYTPIVELLYVTMMLTWLILKVISHGLFLNPHAAISSVWDVIDWILILDSLLLLCLSPVWIKSDFLFFSLDISIVNMITSIRILYIIRCFRSLHMISILDSLKAVLKEIVEGWKNLGKATIILLGFMFMFASLGVQIFTGTDDNPLAFCNDPTINLKEKCTGEFTIALDTSREFIPISNNLTLHPTMLVPRVWYSYTRDFPLQDVLNAFITLSELLTLEGWPDVRDMFDGRNRATDIYMTVYIHIFVFFAVNIGLQLFLGIVVNNFNEHKPGHTFLLTVEQNRWAELMQRISLQRPDKLPQEPRSNIIRLKLFRLLTHSSFRWVPTTVVILSVLTLVVPWDEDYVDKPVIIGLLAASVCFNMYTVLEIILKILAFGPAYFQSWRNLFDLFLSLVTSVYAVLGTMILLLSGYEIYYKDISYFALTLAIVKIITIMIKFSSMLNLLLTVVSTIVRSWSLIMVVLVISVCYALLGVVFFSNIRNGEAIDDYLVNFKGSNYAFSSVGRTITGEDWYQLMWDLAVEPPYCDSVISKDCGNVTVSVLYFLSLTVAISFILLNVLIAVLLENFSIFYNDEETNLDLVAMKDFKRKWRIFDLKANGNIPIEKVKLLLRSLDQQTYYAPGEAREFVTLTNDPLLLWEMEEELRQEIISATHRTPNHGGGQTHPSSSFDSSDINVQFLNVLRMLAYRCEDIYKRLEPHELFMRRELEENVQLDVAEECILKWLKKRVKPRIEILRELERNLQNQGEAVNDGQPTTTVTVKDKRKQLFAMRNAHSQFLDVQGWGKQRSLDTEDEDTEFRRLSLSHALLPATSDEQIDYVGIDQTANVESCAIRSFNKIKQSYVPNDNNTTREWLKMQEEWVDKIGTDQNYFDDRL